MIVKLYCLPNNFFVENMVDYFNKIYRNFREYSESVCKYLYFVAQKFEIKISGRFIYILVLGAEYCLQAP